MCTSELWLPRWDLELQSLVTKQNTKYAGNVSVNKEGKRNVLFNDALNTFYFTVIWRRTYGKGPLKIVREETRCRHMGYLSRLTARVLLYASSHRQDSTYHGLCYTSRGALAGTRNSSMGPHHEGSIRRPIAPWANVLTTKLHSVNKAQHTFLRIILMCIYKAIFLFYKWFYRWLRQRRNEIFYLMTHSTHFIYLIQRRTYGKWSFRQQEETCCHHYMGYSFD